MPSCLAAFSRLPRWAARACWIINRSISAMVMLKCRAPTGTMSVVTRIGGVGRQIVHVERVARCEDDHLVDDVLQLADIAGPTIIDQIAQCFWRDRLDFATVQLVGLLNEMMNERADVLSPIAQGQQVDVRLLQAKEQVLAKLLLDDGLLQIAIGRRDHAHVHVNRAARTDASQLAVLQHTEQLGLHGQRHVADFVEEDRAAVGLFEEAAPVGMLRR